MLSLAREGNLLLSKLAVNLAHVSLSSVLLGVAAVVLDSAAFAPDMVTGMASSASLHFAAMWNIICGFITWSMGGGSRQPATDNIKVPHLHQPTSHRKANLRTRTPQPTYLFFQRARGSNNGPFDCFLSQCCACTNIALAAGGAWPRKKSAKLQRTTVFVAVAADAIHEVLHAPRCPHTTRTSACGCWALVLCHSAVQGGREVHVRSLGDAKRPRFA